MKKFYSKKKQLNAHFHSNPHRLSALKCDCYPAVNYLIVVKYLCKMIQSVTKLSDEIVVIDKTDAKCKMKTN